jgi:5'(3')-deoxyribonucleotidase
LTDQPTRDYPEWNVNEGGGFDALYRYAAARRDLFRAVPPVPGASLALRRLRTLHGIRIRIITHRLYFKHFHRHAVSQTIEWLDRHDFPYDDLCSIEDKTAVKANLYIEDSPSNIEALRAEGANVIAYMTSMNGHLAGPRAHNWQEVVDLVTDFVTEWKKSHPLVVRR